MLVLFLIACHHGGDAADDSVGGSDTPTWNADVAPIVTEHCAGCHTAGGIGPFALDDYASAAPEAAAIADAIDAGTMPPWGAETTQECQPRFGWKDDPRLSDDEKATIRAWADAGAPEGEGTPSVGNAPSLDLDGVSQEVTPATPYAASGDQDEFMCFVMDPGLTETKWLTGTQVVPGNTSVVHHVLLFADPSGASAALAGDDGQYPCFGGVGTSGALLAGWAPGSVPFQMPEGAGIEVTAGSLLVMQVHYHPAGQDASPDSTKVQLRWADSPPERQATLALVGNASSQGEGLLPGPDDEGGVPEFRIPANSPDHTETIEYPIGVGQGPYTVFLVGTHMHYVGTDMRIEVDHKRHEDGVPDTECLLETPRWDFNWQRSYAYDASLDEVPVIRAGDTLRLSCRYDNTLDNPGTRKALADQGLSEPQDVWLGESTLDEMCLGVFGILTE